MSWNNKTGIAFNRRGILWIYFWCFGIGIGAPSPQDKERGILLPTPNLPNLEVPLVEPLVKRFKIPAYLENDANAAAEGELLFGAKNVKI